MQFKDQLNNIITLTKTPQRIVSLVPSQTELLVDLGLGDKLVGITKFCVHPSRLRKEIKVVGGTKTLHFDKVQQVSPDLIICNKEENTREMVMELQKIAPVWVSDIYTIEESLQMIESIGAICDVKEKASEIIETIQFEKQDFLKFINHKLSQKVAYVIWKKPLMVAGKNTFINTLLKLNKFENVCEENTRYPEIDISKLKNVDQVLLSTEPFPFKQKDAQRLSNEIGKPVKIVDGEFFSWYGSRLGKAFQYFKTLHK